MEILKIVFSSIILSAVSVNAEFYKFEDCTQAESPVLNISVLQVSPDPIKLKKNMHIKAHINVLREIPEGTIVKTKIYRLKQFWGKDMDVPIPCFFGKIGSCTKDLCQSLELHKDQLSPFFPENETVGCPVLPGEYGGDIEIPVPKLGPLIKMFIKGKYRTEIEIIIDGNPVACFKIWVEIA